MKKELLPSLDINNTMKRIRFMKSIIFLSFLALILLASFFTTEALGQDSVNSAIIAGRMRLSLTNSATDLVRPSARAGTIAVQVEGTNLTVPVKLNANKYEYKGSFGTRTNYSLSAVEFAITSTGSTQFTWLCWAWPWDHPHDFAVFTTTNNLTYAVYVSNAGVNLFLVSSPVTPEAARNLFLENETSFGNVRRLDNAVILAAGNKYFGMNALYLEMSLDRVDVVNGELRVTLHGAELRPQFTYVLRNGEWSLLSE